MATAAPADPTALTLWQAVERLRQGRLSPVHLTDACLRRIERLNPALNAFIRVTADSALDQARAAEAELRAGRWRGPLHGIPVALKDLIDVAGVPTTAASALFEHNVPRQDAPVVARLCEAGAVLLGKLNLHEFAYGGSGVVSHYGPSRNPWATDHMTGGSSSGSAAAVAAGLCYAALGTDTAGSIRLPAACCGIVGFKPTFGAVSTRGVVPLSWSYDHVGPMARTVRDTAALYSVIAGFDADDPNSRLLPPLHPEAELGRDTRALRVGVAREYFFDGLAPDVATRIEEALKVLMPLVRTVRDCTLPVDADRTVQACESWAWHADSVARSPELYQPQTLRRLRAGENVSACEYIRGRRELERLRRHALESFIQADVDLIVTPTSPIPAPALAEVVDAPDELRRRELLMLRNTRPWNVLGAPAVSVPCGFTGDGLPVGLQIAGPPGHDGLVLRLAYAYERASGWISTLPAL
jgi:aspartyl-tRNA(Asn)/glutamyl-tRNA(Gln) amidotransferase subunit A